MSSAASLIALEPMGIGREGVKGKWGLGVGVLNLSSNCNQQRTLLSFMTHKRFRILIIILETQRNTVLIYNNSIFSSFL